MKTYEVDIFILGCSPEKTKETVTVEAETAEEAEKLAVSGGLRSGWGVLASRLVADDKSKTLFVTIQKNKYGSLFADAPMRLFQFEYRKDDRNWFFWLRGVYDPDIIPGRRFPMEFFQNACLAKFFILNGGPMYKKIEITEGANHLKAK